MPSFTRFGNELYTGARSYDIVGRSRVWYAVAATMIVLSLAILGFKGINPGIEFRGGSEFTLSNVANTSGDAAREVLAQQGITEAARITTVGSNSLRIQTTEMDAEQVATVRSALAEAYDIELTNVTSTFIGPTWGQDVTNKALQGLVIFLVLVSVVMAAYFRTWKMSAAAVTALIHDVIVTVGLYALVGFEVTPASVIGFLTILGYSLYDTVVVFDKVRENTARIFDQDRVTYAEAANLAVNQTLVRSINTSVVGVLPVASILFVGT
ncbi:MAG: protein translocase subunit SecF, partial [Actinomycetales bacterium]|nr:protein translocase subunit SecF [Actinomycetales bacterium]